jgi:alpha-L-fucosidase
VDNLVDLYCSSVGRNSKLLLNVPPTRDGLLHPTDVARLAGTEAQLSTMFAEDALAGRWVTRPRAGRRTAQVDMDLARTATVGIARLEEDITRGQSVARYALYGSDGDTWFPLSHGTTIGYAKLDRFDPVGVRRVRLVIEDAVGGVGPVTVRLYEAGSG